MNRQGKLLIIIVCAALCIAVCIDKIMNRDKDSQGVLEDATAGNSTMETSSSADEEEMNENDTYQLNLTNPELLYELDLKEDIYAGMLSVIGKELQRSLPEKIDKEILELTIVEDSIELSKIQLAYKITIENTYILPVVVHRYTCEHQFGFLDTIDD